MLRAALQTAMLLASLAFAQCAHAHDSWFTADGQIVTGSRYPAIDLTVPHDSILASDCKADACWAELKAFDIELDAKLVAVYFRDAKPADSVRARWSELRAKGVPWQERYRKFARAGMGTTPAGLDLEIVSAEGAAPQPGATVRFRLLSNNRPVANQPVELLSDRSPLGIWSRTNERGEVQWPIPFAARWLVRTIVIEPQGDAKWRSRFATLVFDVR